MITLKFYYYVEEINNELGEVLRRILKRSIFEGSFDIGRYICSFQSRRRDGTLKRKVERYLEKITVSRNCFSRRSIDRGCSFAISSLCKNWWVFHKAERIRFKTVLFHFIARLRIRNTFAFHCIFLIVFKSTAWERDEPRDSYIRIFAIYPHDIDDIPPIYTLFRPGSSCIIIWGCEERAVCI